MPAGFVAGSLLIKATVAKAGAIKGLALLSKAAAGSAKGISTGFKIASSASIKAFGLLKKAGLVAMRGLARGLVPILRGVAKLAIGVVRHVFHALQNIASKAIQVIKVGFVALTGLVVSSVKDANEWQIALGRIASIAHSLGVNTQEVARRILGMNKAFGSSTEMAKAFYDILSAGITDTDKAFETLKYGSMLSKLGVAEMKESINLLASAQNVYGEAYSVKEIADIIQKTQKFGKVANQNLAAPLETILPTAKILGVKLEEIGAAFAVLTKTGRSEAGAATRILRAMTSFIKPTEKLREIVAGVVDPETGEGFENPADLIETKGLQGAIELLSKYVDGVEELRASIGRFRAFEGFAALVGDDGEEFNRILGEMQKEGNATDEAFKHVETTFSAFWNTLNDLKLILGNIVKFAITPFITKVTEAAAGFRDFLINNERNEAIEWLAEKVGILGGWFGFLREMFSQLITFGKTLAGVFKDKLESTLNTNVSFLGNMATEGTGLNGVIVTQIGLIMGLVNAYLDAELRVRKFFTVLGLSWKLLSNPIETTKAALAFNKETSEKYQGLIDEDREKRDYGIRTLRGETEDSTEEDKTRYADSRAYITKQEQINATYPFFWQGHKRGAELDKLDASDLKRAYDDQLALEQQLETDFINKHNAWIKERGEQSYFTHMLEEALSVDTAIVEEKRRNAEDYLNGVFESLSTAISSGSESWANIIRENSEEIIIGIRAILTLGDEEGTSGESSFGTKDGKGGGFAEMLANFGEGLQNLLSIYGKAITQVMTGINDVIQMSTRNTLDAIQLALDAELAALQEAYDNCELSDAEFQDKKKEREDQAKRERNAARKTAFESQRAMDIVNVTMATAVAIAEWAKLAPTVGWPFALGMMLVTTALGAAQITMIANQQFVPEKRMGGMLSGIGRINEAGGEIVSLPDGSQVIPHDISRDIAAASGNYHNGNIIHVSFKGASINSNMDLDYVADRVSEKLGRKLRYA